MSTPQYSTEHVEIANFGTATITEPPTAFYKQHLADFVLIAAASELYLYDEFFDKLLAEDFTSYKQFEDTLKTLLGSITYKPISDYTTDELNAYFKQINARITQANTVVADLLLIDEVNSCVSKTYRHCIILNRLVS